MEKTVARASIADVSKICDRRDSRSGNGTAVVRLASKSTRNPTDRKSTALAIRKKTGPSMNR